MYVISELFEKNSEAIEPISELGERFHIETRQCLEFYDLTAAIDAWVTARGVQAGTVTIRSMHTTAALFLGEWQDALVEDYRRLLQLLVPDTARWKHNDPRYSDCDRRNAAAHLRALLLGSSVSLPVREGRIERGRWQSIIFAELDGPRDRSVGIDLRVAPPEPST